MVKALGEAAKHITGAAPGLDLILYGLVLVVVIGAAPRGVAGLIDTMRGWFRRDAAQKPGRRLP
jgi:branched-chain amino acid transport system permease protein